MPEMPSGTVAFLFTDIEGSTRRWQQSPKDMAAAVARHDALLSKAIAEHEGTVFKTVGDAEERDADYFGPVVNRVARLLSAGHGGQILLSHAASELVRDNLPGVAQLRNLGAPSQGSD